eukprot:325782-Amphidinium_carterae.1
MEVANVSSDCNSCLVPNCVLPECKCRTSIQHEHDVYFMCSSPSLHVAVVTLHLCCCSRQCGPYLLNVTARMGNGALTKHTWPSP